MYFCEPVWFDSLDSTNSYLKQQVEKNPSSAVNGTVIVAKSQTHGKGRYDRLWQDFPGRNLTFSWLLKEDMEISSLPALPLVTGLAVGETLTNLGLNARLKWPNDVLVNRKKICGILSEYVRCPDGITAAIVGIGLNVNMDKISAEKIDKPATSILIENGKENNIEDILRLLLDHLSVCVDKWKIGGFAAIRQQWLNMCDHIGKQIEVLTADSAVQTGIFENIGRNGQIILRTPENQLKEIWAGDVFPVDY